MSKDWEDKIEIKLDNLSENITEIKLQGASNSTILSEHIRRSEANEKQVELLGTIVQQNKEHLENRIAPLARVWDRTKFLFTVISTIIAGLLSLQALGVFTWLRSIF